jgi:hypothetical protein
MDYLVSTPVARQFDLAPHTVVRRKQLHEMWGGRTQGGISPSRTTPNIFIFWSPAVGEKHGYFDEWRDDGCFYYTGAGQFGDQRMHDVNLALLRHRADGRAVRLFAGSGGNVRYEGELRIDNDEPYYETEAPETGAGPLRKVFVFKFRAVTATPEGSKSRLEAAIRDTIEDVPVEKIWTERFFVNPAAEEYEAERREQALVRDLELELRSRGHDVARLKIVPEGERRPLFCDLIDRTSGVLVEAKGSVAREAVRMAIGQLMDYRRFVPADFRLSVLLPEEPRADLQAFLRSVNVEAIWPDDRGYADTAGGIFA